MLGIGLKVDRFDIASNLKNRALMGKSLLVNFVIVPIIAFILLQIFPLPRIDEIAVILLSLAPEELSALQFTTKSDPDTLGFSAALLFVLSLLSIIITPLLIMIFRSKYELTIPYSEFIIIILLLILLPLVIGLYMGEKKEN
jgi:BASS family bile acid:Na+ symporter